VPTMTLRPNGDHTSCWLPYPDTLARYQCVDEETPNEDTDYINTETIILDCTRQSFNFTDPPTQSGTITNVRIVGRCRKYVGYPDVAWALFSGVGSLWQDGVERTTMPTSYTDFYDDFPQRTGGGAWSWSDIVALTGGIIIYANPPGTAYRCTQVYAVVTFTEVVGYGYCDGLVSIATGP